MTACIVGWAQSHFGRLGGEALETLIVNVGIGATAAVNDVSIPDRIT